MVARWARAVRLDGHDARLGRTAREAEPIEHAPRFLRRSLCSRTLDLDAAPNDLPSLGEAVGIVTHHVLATLARQCADESALIGKVVTSIMEIDVIAMP
jgi:hypothetical protein